MVAAKQTLLSLILLSGTAFADSSAEYSSMPDSIVQSKQTALTQGQNALGDEYMNKLLRKNEAIHSATFSTKVATEHQDSVEPQTDIYYVILVSDAMGKRELKHLFKSLSHRNDVSFVVRGILPTEKTITDVGKRIIGLIKDLPEVPNVNLDPRPFQNINAEYAPQILMYKGDSVVLSAAGLVNPNYLKTEFEKGKRGDLGNFGSMVKISERDLTEVLKERAALLDKETLIADAKDRFWDNVAFTALPNATETLVRSFVPEVVVREDMVTPNGDVIAFAGERINRLNTLPFTQRLVVFDPTDRKQMEFVQSLPESPLRTKFIATRFDRSLKWDAVKSVERQLNASVYQLKPELVTAFDLQVVPSIVTADHQRKVFVISETKMED
ncbi:TrbC family F-type conjugative pilus assembly protein [Vibrio sp. 1733]|uniref:TrbC family F-type conjugative pilus assembly protein n=1 Tax=unclassified Vibrio TaxID=2614977 RepID=UPI0029647BC0|nr:MULTISPECIES: TrbC family F-type conjugative pilus assembly protein [unclassified Vibrio]MDW1968022.1 TrbC family F-type conjugative pilus assembly protein [Vibrio sp. Vb0587]MDW2188956.1 TrbC family F-type conjugative pilus assembly protein [Vibrio sp. 1733]MDW2238873.1 TrbC family F-type conjugative pilus assembly protein [Vibrio sp. 1565-1]HCG6133833.1 hypothetical protein [Vibrio parahaemolyticus]